jgi:hypothetical protein
MTAGRIPKRILGHDQTRRDPVRSGLAGPAHVLPGGIASVQRAVEITEILARDHPEMTRYQLDL